MNSELNFKNLEILKNWIKSKLEIEADQIEINCKTAVNLNADTEFIRKWISRQPIGKPIDSDLLALRTMETLTLLSISNYCLFQDKEKDFKILEEKLINLSEAIGLIRSLSDNQISLAAETSMDIDFNPSTEFSTFFDLKQNEFDIYLLEKFKNCERIKEIIEIVAERCGIPLESDFEDEKKPVNTLTSSMKSKEPTKHVNQTKEIKLKFYYLTLCF